MFAGARPAAMGRWTRAVVDAAGDATGKKYRIAKKCDCKIKSMHANYGKLSSRKIIEKKQFTHSSKYSLHVFIKKRLIRKTENRK